MMLNRLNKCMSGININQESIDRYVRQSQMRSMFDLNAKKAINSNDKGTFGKAVQEVINENLGNSEATNAIESMRNQTMGKSRDGKPTYGTQYLKTQEHGEYAKSFDETTEDDLKSLGLENTPTDEEIEKAECKAGDDEWCDNEECPKCYEQDQDKKEYPTDDQDAELESLLKKDKLNETFDSLYDNAINKSQAPNAKNILEAIKSDYTGQSIEEGVMSSLAKAGGNALKAVGDVASIPGKVVSSVGSAIAGDEEEKEEKEDKRMTIDELKAMIKAMSQEEQEQWLKDIGVQDVTDKEQINEAIGALVGGAARGVGAVARGAGAVLGGAAKAGAALAGGLAAGAGAAIGGAAAGMMGDDKEDEEKKAKKAKKKSNPYTKEMSKVDKMNNDLSEDHEDEEHDDAQDQEHDAWEKAREIVDVAKEQGLGQAPWEDHDDIEDEEHDDKPKMSKYAKRIKRAIKKDAEGEDAEDVKVTHKKSLLKPGRKYTPGDGVKAQKELQDKKAYTSAHAGFNHDTRTKTDAEWDEKNKRQHDRMMAKAKAGVEDAETKIKPPKFGKLKPNKKGKELEKEKVKKKGIVKENSQWGITPEPHVDLVQEKTMVEGYANAFTKYLK